MHSQSPAPTVPAPAPQSCSLSQSIPCHPKRLGLTWHGTRAQCRPCSFSRLCPHPSRSGHVPRGALWHAPNYRDLPALLMSLLSAQCQSCNHEHRLFCTPQPLCSQGSLSVLLTAQPHVPQHPLSAYCRTRGAHPTGPGSHHQSPNLPALWGCGWGGIPLGDEQMFPGDVVRILLHRSQPRQGTQGNHCSTHTGRVSL